MWWEYTDGWWNCESLRVIDNLLSSRLRYRTHGLQLILEWVSGGKGEEAGRGGNTIGHKRWREGGVIAHNFNRERGQGEKEGTGGNLCTLCILYI